METHVYNMLASESKTYTTDLDKGPYRRLAWSDCRAWLEVHSDVDKPLHLEGLQHAAPEH